jgi:phosphoglycerate dehydrogenase-like enzyme
MKILLSESALARAHGPLQDLGVALEPIVVRRDGTILENGGVVDEATIAPEAMWVTIDIMADGGLERFFRIALSSPTLKWVQTFMAGLDSPLFRQILDRGVRISNTHAQAPGIADYILSQVLAEWHPIKDQRAAQAEHTWARLPFRELAESEWLIVGYGHIGRETARRAKAFGARVIGVRRTPAPDPDADAIAPFSELPKLLPQADIVVLAASLNGATQGMADARFFAAMKKDAILVNVGRGGLIAELDLLSALDRNRPGLAILDVFEVEPLPQESPFWDHPKIRVTAHCSAATAGMFARIDQIFLENTVRYAKGEPLLNEVNASTLG